MYCPACGHKQYCGCKACTERGFPPGDKPWVDFPQSNEVSCGNCGFKRNIHWWEDLSYEVAIYNFSDLDEKHRTEKLVHKLSEKREW